MKMSAKEFHAFFNAGRNNIFAILDADTGDEKTQGEKDVIEALKKRINYYGEAYDRQRASERINESTEAKEEPKIIKMNIPAKTETDNAIAA